MWNRAVVAGIILIAGVGCRSPQTVLRTLQSCDPCFAASVAVHHPIKHTAESGSIEEYVQLGLARNPQVLAAQHNVDAVRHRIPQVLSLPDPMVNTTTHLSPVQTAAGEQAFSLGVSQKITNAERRATRAAIVSDEVAAAQFAWARSRVDLAASIRTTCYQLLFIRKSIEIRNEDSESLERISEVILRQYEVKESVTQQDVLNVQTEQSKLENQLTELEQKQISLQARLARLLHVSPHSDLLIGDGLEVIGKKINVDELIEQASESRPDLQSQLANIQRDRKRVHLARLEEVPDFTVGLSWIATSSNGISPIANGDDAVLFGVGFNLPIYKSRIRAGICEAQSNRLAAESQFASLQDQSAEEVFDRVAKLDSTRDTLTLIQEDILPKAERTLELSIEEYATDSIPYVQLITNWRNVLRYRLSEADLQSQYQQLMASLTRSVGQVSAL